MGWEVLGISLKGVIGGILGLYRSSMGAPAPILLLEESALTGARPLGLGLKGPGFIAVQI
jgi:hypothetical protein